MTKVPALKDRLVTPDDLMPLAQPVGELILSFSLLENQIDFWLMAIFEMAQRQNVASKLPHQTGEKIGLLQRCFERIKELSHHRDNAIELLQQADELNTARNTIVHGSLSHAGAEPDRSLVFAKLRYDKPTKSYGLTDHVITFTSIEAASQNALGVVKRMLSVSEQLHGREPGEWGGT